MRMRNAHPDSVALFLAGPQLLDMKRTVGPYRVYSPILDYLRGFVRSGCHFG